MNLNEIYRSITVKIECNGMSGSGCLYQPDSDDYSYVFTAKHCLKGKEGQEKKFAIEDIKISMHERRKIWNSNFKVLDFKLAEDGVDLAVIVIEKFTMKYSPKICKLRDNISKGIKIYGYPKAIEKELIPTQVLTGEFIQNIEGVVEFKTNDNIHTYADDAKKYLDGFSGCGIFIEVDNELILTSIYTSVKNQDVAYSVLIGECISEIDNLLQTSGLKKLTEYTPQYKINLSKRYKNLTEWEKLVTLNSDNWVETENNRELIEYIKTHLKENNENNLLHIIGKSGSGKTRTAFQACYEDDKLKHVMYFEKYGEIKEELKTYIKTNNTNRYVLVIDDVSLDEWQMLDREFISYNNIRIISIGVVQSSDLHDRIGVKVNKCPSDEDMKLIINSNSDINDEGIIEYIVNLCENDLRLAIMFKDIIKKDTDKSILNKDYMVTRFTSVESILNRIIEQYASKIENISEFKEIYMKLCMFIDIGYKNEFRNELESIERYFNIEKGKIDIVIDKAQNCALGACKGEFFEPAPRAISQFIFEEKSWHLIKNNLSSFFEVLPEKLKKRFIDRTKDSKSTIQKEVEKALAEWFRIEFCEYDLNLILDVEKAKIFKSYTEFSPKMGLNWLKISIKNATKEEIVNWSEYSFGNDSRRYIVWLCESLSHFKEYFYDCEEILFRLLQYETEKYITNNSTGVWKSLFSLIGSNTNLDFESRYRLLLERLNKCSIENLNTVLEAIKLIFEDKGMIILPPKVIGRRIVPTPWKVSNYKELLSLRFNFINEFLICSECQDKDKRNIIRNFIINNLNVFIDNGGLENIQKYIWKEIDKSEIYILKNSIEQYIYIKEKFNESVNDKHRIDKCYEWIDSINLNFNNDQIYEFISKDYWNRYHILGEEKLEKEKKEIALKILKDNVNLYLYNELFESEECNYTAILNLAKKIGELDVEDKYEKYIICMIEKNKSNNFVKGYLLGQVLRDKNLKGTYKRSLDDNYLIHTDFVLDITISTDVSADGYKRILNCINNNLNNINILYNLQYIEWNDLLDESNKATILEVIDLNLGYEQAINLVIHLNHMWNRKGNKSMSDNRAKLVLKHLKNCVSEDIKFDIWNWYECIKTIPGTYINKVIELLVLGLEKSGINTYMINEYSLQLLSEVAKSHSNLVMEMLGKKLIKDNNRIVYIKSYKLLFESIKINDVKSWINRNGIEGARAIARHMSSPKLIGNGAVDIPVLTEWLLENYGYDDILFSEFISGRHSLEVVDIDEIIRNHDELIEKISPYLSHRLNRVQEWAKYEIKYVSNFKKEEEIIMSRQRRER